MMADVANLTLLAAFESDQPLEEAELRRRVSERAPNEPGLDERVAAALTYWTHEGLLERADPKREETTSPRRDAPTRSAGCKRPGCWLNAQ